MVSKELVVCHLYGNLLNTYGDNGNLLMLKYLTEKMGVTFRSEIISIYEPFDPEKYDLSLILAVLMAWLPVLMLVTI